MRNVMMRVVWVVLIFMIAGEQTKNPDSKTSHCCSVQDFKQVVERKAHSTTKCFIWDTEDTVREIDSTEEFIEGAAPTDSYKTKCETLNQDLSKDVQGSPTEKKDTQNNDKILDPGILQGVVSEKTGEASTEPKAPDVLQGAHSTVTQPVITPPVLHQNLEVPTTKYAKDKDKEKPVDDVLPPKPTSKTDDMPSFDEWKRLRLQEEEEVKERNKQQQQQHHITSSTANNSPQKIKGNSKGNVNRVNYAAASCGAKIMGANSEAQSVGSILSENKDKYVIQPCKAKKWISIELCEPIQVTAIELGNLEFFSSQPESFMIYISDRLTTKDWTSIGTFHARDVRQIQSFPVSDDLYAKYIKIEMLSHYGREHYCPLTVVRVFGTTVHEEDGDDTQEDEIEAQPVETREDSLLKLAIETAQSMLQDVIGKKEEPNAEQGVKLADIEQKNDTNETKPCPPDVKLEGAVNGSKGQASIFPETPKPTTTFSDKTDRGHVIIPPIVRLIQEPYTSLQEFLASCRLCDQHQGNPNSCLMDRYTVCGYYRWMVYTYPTCCRDYYAASTPPPVIKPEPKKEKPLDLHTFPVVQPDSIVEEKTKSTLSIIDVRPNSIKLKASEKPKIEPKETTKQAKPDSSKVKETDGTKAKLSITPDNGKEKQPLKHQIPVPEIKATKTQQASMTTKEATLEASKQSIPTQTKHTEKLKPSSTIISESETKKTEALKETKTEAVAQPEANTETPCNTDSAETVNGGCQMGPEVVVIRPSSTEEVAVTETLKVAMQNNDNENVIDHKNPSVQPHDSKETDKAKDPQDTRLPDSAEATDTNGKHTNNEATNNINNKDTHIYASDKIPDLEDIEMAEQEADEEVQVTKKSQLKETAIMKLRNRIKELELNLNLSSRYLEELSQTYKRQMEEMYKFLNHTIEKLSDNSRTADERDKRQQQEIKNLEEMYDRMNRSVQNLGGNMDGLVQQVTEQHLVMMVIQCVVFFLIIMWVLRRGGQTPAPALLPPITQQAQANRIQETPAETSQPSNTAVSSHAHKRYEHLKKQQQQHEERLRFLKQSSDPSAKRESSHIESLSYRGARSPSLPSRRIRRRRNSSDGTPVKLNKKTEVLEERRSQDDIALESMSDNKDMFPIEIAPILPGIFGNDLEADGKLPPEGKGKKKRKVKGGPDQFKSSRSFDLSSQSSQKNADKSRRSSIEHHGMSNGLTMTNGVHSRQSSVDSLAEKGKHQSVASVGRNKHNWDFVRKSGTTNGSHKPAFDSSSSSSSSVKSFRKK